MEFPLRMRSRQRENNTEQQVNIEASDKYSLKQLSSQLMRNGFKQSLHLKRPDETSYALHRYLNESARESPWWCAFLNAREQIKHNNLLRFDLDRWVKGTISTDPAKMSDASGAVHKIWAFDEVTAKTDSDSCPSLVSRSSTFDEHDPAKEAVIDTLVLHTCAALQEPAERGFRTHFDGVSGGTEGQSSRAAQNENSHGPPVGGRGSGDGNDQPEGNDNGSDNDNNDRRLNRKKKNSSQNSYKRTSRFKCPICLKYPDRYRGPPRYWVGKVYEIENLLKNHFQRHVAVDKRHLDQPLKDRLYGLKRKYKLTDAAQEDKLYRHVCEDYDKAKRRQDPSLEPLKTLSSQYPTQLNLEATRSSHQSIPVSLAQNIRSQAARDPSAVINFADECFALRAEREKERTKVREKYSVIEEERVEKSRKETQREMETELRKVDSEFCEKWERLTNGFQAQLPTTISSRNTAIDVDTPLQTAVVGDESSSDATRPSLDGHSNTLRPSIDGPSNTANPPIEHSPMLLTPNGPEIDPTLTTPTSFGQSPETSSLLADNGSFVDSGYFSNNGELCNRCGGPLSLGFPCSCNEPSTYPDEMGEFLLT